jgi:prepilin-type N-terminal cleavage/methylation domain-containing protein
MSLENIKSKTQSERGFTIVELLIVVVVIAILAAITIVSYNGITNRANASAAQSTAAALQKKAELYASDGPTGQYPKVQADLTTGTGITGKSYYVATDSIKFTTTPATAPTAANGKDTVQYQPCGTGSVASTMTAVNGAKITWWDFTKGSSQPTTILIGDTSGTCATTNT